MKIKKIFLSGILSIIFCFSILAELKVLNFIVYSINFDKSKYIEGVVADEATMTSSYSSNLSSYTNCRQAYFDNLTYNFGQNYKGSCGYVALGMLLSYYDTYLNDCIIPENYDVKSSGFDANIISRHNSPGILRDTIIEPNSNIFKLNYATNLDTHDYLAYMYSISEQSLHAKLITIGAERNYYNYADKKGACGTTSEQRKIVLKDYLYSELGFIEKDKYNIESIAVGEKYYREGTTIIIENDHVRQWTISKIQSGYPVLVGASGWGGSHAFIAYDYDAASDKIYCHMGWGANTTHVTNESKGFKNINSAMVIDFYLLHNHPQNYEVISTIDNKTTTTKYCICSDDIMSIHEHSYIYTGRGEEMHQVYCPCGVRKSQNHIYTHSYTNTDSSTHIAYCGCGMSISESHTYGKYQKYNNDFHASYCECGEQKIIRHKYITFNVSGHEIIQCVLCGQYKYEAVIDPGMNSTTIEEYFLNLEVERQQKRKTKTD